MMGKTKIVIIQHNGGRLANQLWLIAYVYAFCLDRGYDLEFPFFYEYSSLLEMQQHLPWLSRVAQFLITSTSINRSLVFEMYKLIISVYLKLRRKYVIDSTHSPIFLPPSNTAANNRVSEKKLSNIAQQKEAYFVGWQFRNPIGMKKYRKHIQQLIHPPTLAQEDINRLIQPLRRQYQTLVGVHIRQGDYTKFENGRYFISPESVANILKQYISRHSSQNIVFIICSDGPVDPHIFADVPFVLGLGEPMQDLFTLAACDLVIGSFSTYGYFAAEYAGIPFYTFQNGSIEKTEVL